jgi:exosortase A-associated hydrolase 2
MNAIDGMAAMQVAAPQPFFLDTPHGRLFAIHHRPATGLRGSVLCVPPFNEEMNRCRSMITLQAQAFAAAGIGTLVLDLHGTGDSSGEYRDARWSIWLDDIRTACRWLENQSGGCLAYWGIRLGAILAAQASRSAATKGRQLIVWQPVIDGKQYFTQFLRMRIAANMDRPSLPKETTAGMREILANGKSVEIAGYEIHPQLAAAIDVAQLAATPPAIGTSVLWLEQASAGTDGPSPASAQAASVWHAAGIEDGIRLFDGPAFWQLHQRAVAPEAIAATTAWAIERWGTA